MTPARLLEAARALQDEVIEVRRRIRPAPGWAL
jgi:hypothetical protein